MQATNVIAMPAWKRWLARYGMTVGIGLLILIGVIIAYINNAIVYHCCVGFHRSPVDPPGIGCYVRVDGRTSGGD